MTPRAARKPGRPREARAEPGPEPGFVDVATRTELLNRLRRAEGQLRGIQRMIEEGQPCRVVAGQMTAVRKALDSAAVRMTVCHLEAGLRPLAGAADGAPGRRLDAVLGDLAQLLGQVR